MKKLLLLSACIGLLSSCSSTEYIEPPKPVSHQASDVLVNPVV